ncbi:MAG TPA: heme ABC transporter ATP-binding protein [Fodinibius sp.]|nr:heme ABC transporter ATP-binding protein [Fodinibius sp.]
MISIKNLSVSIESTQLLHNISATLPAGKLSICLGRNGAGKSTLLKAICRDIPAEGTVQYKDIPADKLTNRFMATRRAIVSQHGRLSFDFTVEEVVLMGRIPQINGFETDHDYQVAEHCMQKLGVLRFRTRSYPSLSGGEKQRVRCAAALAQIWDNIEEKTPTYLFLDEPTSSLDLAHQHQLLHLLKEIAQKGVTVFAIVHDLNLVAQYGEHLLVLHEGKLFKEGPPAKIFHPGIIKQAFGCPVHIIKPAQTGCPFIIAQHNSNNESYAFQ